jgi:hypothetical protein
MAVTVREGCVVVTTYIPSSLRSRQVGAIHPLYLYSAMSDTSLPTSSCGRGLAPPHLKKARPPASEALTLGGSDYTVCMSGPYRYRLHGNPCTGFNSEVVHTVTASICFALIMFYIMDSV